MFGARLSNLPIINATALTKPPQPGTPKRQQNEQAFRTRESLHSEPGEGRRAYFDFDLPSHRAGSPSCPAHPLNASRGRGLCVVRSAKHCSPASSDTDTILRLQVSWKSTNRTASDSRGRKWGTDLTVGANKVQFVFRARGEPVFPRVAILHGQDAR